MIALQLVFVFIVAFMVGFGVCSFCYELWSAIDDPFDDRDNWGGQ